MLVQNRSTIRSVFFVVIVYLFLFSVRLMS